MGEFSFLNFAGGNSLGIGPHPLKHLFIIRPTESAILA
jgi:hypothetical protein